MRHTLASRFLPRRGGRRPLAFAALAPVMAVLAMLLAPATAHSADSPITPAAGAVTASTHDGNVPGNVVDGDYGTRWSGEGDGAWLQFDLGATMTVSRVELAVHKGTTRQNVFQLQYWNGSAWATVHDGETSGTTTALESFGFDPVQTSKVRYLGHGYTGDGEGDWNSLTEVEIWGRRHG
ncbi:discoidin domain-containing protein [Streptomyces sp. NPDC048845]|uniref:discoidin domain-containing protein n=1 Tax=Streptomyces sp. NPDC048845 TaxID=3155390 RepID=UPI003413D871